MFKEKFVTVIKHNGRIMREQGDTTYLPFGSEYSLLLKNKNSVRALVTVEIDGVDATGGTQLIIPANGEVNLERFIKAGDLESGNRFKFIERTKKIEDGPRGIRAEDGLIRIEFEFEQMQTLAQHGRMYESPSPWWHSPSPWHSSPWYGGSTSSASLQGSTCSMFSDSLGTPGEACSITNPMNASGASVQAKAAINDIGITVPGSISDQKFVVGAARQTDGQKHVMILKLLGKVGDTVVKEPLTVKHKPQCTTCGSKNKANAKFCSECGTSLLLV